MIKSGLEKEIQLKIVDQLHNAVAQFSSFCFEIKKFCITTLFIILTFLVTFTNKSLDLSLFIITYITTICFWFLDATAYYYQVKLRANIDIRLDKIRSLKVEQDTIEDSRVNKKLLGKLKDAIFNHSMWIYYILIVLNSIAFYMFRLKIIS